MFTRGGQPLPDIADRAVDAIGEHLAIVDREGAIIAVNRAWTRFAVDNGVADPAEVGVRANYLDVCRRARPRTPSAERALRGLTDVLTGRTDQFEMVYACPGYGRRHWFTMQVTAIHGPSRCAVVAHFDLTRRKVVERRLLRRLRAMADEMTEIEQAERARLSAQLHDHLQQLLVAARLALLAAPLRELDERAESQLQQARHFIDEAIKATRSLSAQIRPPALEEAGLPDALQQLTQQHEQLYNIPVDYHVAADSAKIPHAVAAFVYHATREMLFNAVKHAHASRQWVTLACDRRTLRITVADDGVGADPETLRCEDSDVCGTGLTTIRQRLRYFSGRMEVETAPGRGTAITLTLPLAAAPEPR